MAKKHRDIFTGLFFLAFSVVMYISTFNIVGLTDVQLGADFMPKLTSIAIAITSIGLIVNGFRKGTETAATAEMIENKENTYESIGEESRSMKEVGTKDSKKKLGYISLIFTVILMIGYLILLPILGFLIASILYLFLQMMLFSDWRSKKIPLYLMISIVTSAFIYYVFRNLFYVMLPSGILG